MEYVVAPVDGAFLASSRSNCCCGSRDVAASHSQTAVAAAGTLRRHTLRLLLRQQRRCGVTFAIAAPRLRWSTLSHAGHLLCGKVSVEFVALASAVIAAPAVVVPVSDTFVVPAPAWCAAPASTTGYILQSDECILRRAFAEEVV